MSTNIKIGDVDVTAYVAFPVKWNDLLDKRLDEARLSLRNTPTPLFSIGKRVMITNGATRNFILAADESTEIPAGSGRFNHELSVIEPTKILEGIIVETLKFTNSLGRSYTSNPTSAPAYLYGLNANTGQWIDGRFIATPTPPATSLDILPQIKDLLSPQSADNSLSINAINEQMIPSPIGHFENSKFNPSKETDADCPLLTLISPSGIKYEKRSYSEGITVDNPEVGQWTAYYNFYYYYNSTQAAPHRVEYLFNVAKNEQPLPKWNIRMVIDRVLNLAEPHLSNVEPRFKLNPAQAAGFEDILAPEFAFTQKTLKEILDEIGGFIHGIPRLIADESGELNTIHFDMLGGTEYADLDDLPYITQVISQNIEDYATDIDSSVENFVNSLNTTDGSIVEPYRGGYRSVRSEQAYARIDEGNMIIQTTLPIYTVQSLTVKTPSGKRGDLTAYVFEGSEYGRLSSFDGVYPSSKAFAVYYNLGEKNIKGLAFKTPHVLGTAFAKYAIANIIYAATGEEISADWWSSSNPDDDEKYGKYPRLQFNIVYTPIFADRVTMHKTYHEVGAFQRSLAYNQGANLVETRYYGENLKGTIARIGNAELTRTYRTHDMTRIPSIGQLFIYNGDDYYVSTVTVALYAESVDWTVSFSKDFNMLSQYIGINSEWRAYEVSERKAYDRDNVYPDFAVIGDITSDRKCQITQQGMGEIFQIFHSYDPPMDYTQRITAACVRFIDDDMNQIESVVVPVVSTPFANVLSFEFGMADNFSAGVKSVQQDPSEEASGYWQTDVQYTDYSGRAKYVRYELGWFGPQNSSTAPFDLPEGNYIENSRIYTPTETPLVIDKDGGERMRFHYELQFVTTHKDIVIGSAMARRCPLVGADFSNEKYLTSYLYTFPKRIGKFVSEISLVGATNTGWSPTGIQLDYTARKLIFPTAVAPADCEAWAIVAYTSENTTELLFGQNKHYNRGDTIIVPPITFTHELP